MTPNRKAIALLSGGLDSLLAAKLVKEQGIEVIGLHLLSPFGCREEIEKRAAAIGVPLLYREKGAKYLDLVEKPRYGYGRAVNPCIDCRIFMFDIAWEVMQEVKADFIITGEVLGQRPMSQQKFAMDLIDRKSGIDDYVLRPLSAKAFEPTLPEREGWVDREKLFDIRGRGRKDQIALTKVLGVSDYATPGGGCLLTEVSFGPKLKDFYAHEHFKNEEQKLRQSELLRYGRHFRLSERAKVIVSKNEAENFVLAERWQDAGGTFLHPVQFTGPAAMILGEAGAKEREMAGALIARYGKPSAEGRVAFQSPSEQGDFAVPPPLHEETLEEMRL